MKKSIKICKTKILLFPQNFSKKKVNLCKKQKMSNLEFLQNKKKLYSKNFKKSIYAKNNKILNKTLLQKLLKKKDNLCNYM